MVQREARGKADELFRKADADEAKSKAIFITEREGGAAKIELTLTWRPDPGSDRPFRCNEKDVTW